MAVCMVKVGDTVTRTAMNGHTFDYTVTGSYPDGRVRTRQFDAVHSDACRCADWEDGDRSLPDW